MSDSETRSLEVVASELVQGNFLRRAAINWGIVAVLVLLLVTSVLIALSIASGRGELESEVEKIRIKWAYDQGRADEAEARQQELVQRLAESEALADRSHEVRKAMYGQLLMLRAIEEHIDAGGGDAPTREFIAEAKRRRAESASKLDR